MIPSVNWNKLIIPVVRFGNVDTSSDSIMQYFIISKEFPNNIKEHFSKERTMNKTAFSAA